MFRHSEKDFGTNKEFFKGFDPGNFSFAHNFRRHGGMKYYVLWLLSQKNLRGSEIIETVQRQTMGWWRPSPGTIYPLLNTLLKDGLVKKEHDLRYSLTPAGAEEIGLKPGETKTSSTENWDIDKILTEIEGYISYLEDEQGNLKDHRERIMELTERLSKLKLE